MILPLYLHGILFNLISNVLARPVLVSENSFRKIISTKLTQRSEWNIIWSCLVTLFPCSWVAIHPNIPPPSDNRWRVLSRRLLTMFYMLLAPEMVIIWAGQQWCAAREIAKRNKEHGWTRTHVFFALMGGFMLYEDGTMSRTLAPEELEHLFADGRIDWPTISEKDIEDKSKGDIFSKGFAVLQTTCHLEVVTVAFAALNAVVYFLWWNKPMDVACPVPVHLRPPLTDTQRPPSKQDTGTQTGDHYHYGTVGNDGSQSPSLEPPTFDLAMSRTDPQFATKLEIEPNLPEPHSSIPLQPSSTFARVWSYIWGKFLSMGPFAILYILIYMPMKIIWCDLGDMLECNVVDNRHGTQSVPAFYAPDSKDAGFGVMIGLILSILFGGIHCTPWSFPFPTIKEQHLWRISAVFVTALPTSLMVLIIVGNRIYVAFIKGHEGWWVVFLDKLLGLSACLALLAYTVARIMLLILPFLALRSLSSGAFVAVSWIISIPHI